MEIQPDTSTRTDHHTQNIDVTGSASYHSQLSMDSYESISVCNAKAWTIFLKNSLGKILPKALTEICEKRPPDPIEELAKWLYQWADCELYYYEKAIFAKEIQLMALQLEKENARRLARMAALRKETSAIKYLLSNEKALLSFLSKTKSSITGMSSGGSDQDLSAKAWARRHFFVDDHGPTDTSVSEGHIQAVARKGSVFSRDKDSEQRKRHRKGIDEDDSTSDSRSEKRKVKRRALGSRRESMLGGEFGAVGRKKGKKMAQIEETFGMFDGDDCYGLDAKRKYGFECTPVRCVWYLAEPRVLVCVHPVLGEMRASIPSVAAATEIPDRWYFQEYSYEVMYDHDIYTIEDPNFDDDDYGDIEVFTWPEVIKVPNEFYERKEEEEANDGEDDDNDDNDDDDDDDAFDF